MWFYTKPCKRHEKGTNRQDKEMPQLFFWGARGRVYFASLHGFCKREMREYVPLLLAKKSYITGPNGDAMRLLLWVCPKFGSIDLESVKKLEWISIHLQRILFKFILVKLCTDIIKPCKLGASHKIDTHKICKGVFSILHFQRYALIVFLNLCLCTFINFVNYNIH